MAAAVNFNGSISITIDPGRTLIVTGEAGAKGSAAILNAGTPEIVDSINGAQARSYGPFASARTCRLYAESGVIDYRISSSVSALVTPGAPTIAPDGRTISGYGVKPGTAVPVYDVDTGLPIGQTTSMADGTWSLTLKDPLPLGVRVGYDPVIVGPYSTVQSNGTVIAPVNTAAPAITGTPQVGKTLSASQGSWSNAPSSFAYQWNRSGAPIFGATGSTYAPSSFDVGYTLTVTVTASNSAGSASSTSASTAVVAPDPTSSGTGTLDFSDPANSGLNPAV